ncbi:MAG TPA: DUF6390 family protein [Segeticoccus sp.]|uniref:DUF6390 family protein n=1 Tax=Segeticoccus sp. TaxID=2706531 RepID=UPI002D80F263|nr:DUF6390 family protein [Segeticoccus sp.]HET8601358.1 DUF6390 family protein [Segeticoccus sp.]
MTGVEPNAPAGRSARRRPVSGPVLFVRYAFPPNSHGYCGPGDNTGFYEYGLSGTVDRGFHDMAKAFAGAWPYLQLIAGATGVPDPLDRRVVEAYWVGNGLLDQIATSEMGGSMEDRFRHRAGPRFHFLADSVAAGGVPHHSYHVFCVYPWVGLLGDDRRAEQALTVLDRCRIRWGRVTAVQGDQVVVDSRPLTYDGGRLELGEPVAETAVRGVDGVTMLEDLAPGDWVSLHWEWICDRLDDRQLQSLRRYTVRQLALVNDGVELSGPRAVLG